MKNSIKKLILMTLIFGTLLSCKKDEIPDGKGEVVVKLTDAPFPYQFVTQANIGITKVELKTTTGEYITVFEASGETGTSYNMVELTNGVTADIQTTNIEAGTYVSARVSMGSASIHFEDSTFFDIDLNAETTYVTSIEPALVVEEGDSSNILFDLDVDQSFHFQAFSGFPFGDWINSIASISGCGFDAHFRVCDLDETGQISGIVTENGTPVENCHVTVIVGGHEIATHTNQNGTYTFIGVVNGTYIVHAETENGDASFTTQVSNNGVASCNITIN